MRVWQKKFITDTFEVAKENNCNYSKALIYNLKLLNRKNKYIPNSIFKFYSATPENLFDIRNRVLWMPSPQYFNDPFDCYLSLNTDEYEKRYLLNVIKKQNLLDELNIENAFTLVEFNKLWNSYTKERYYSSEEWSSVLRNIMEKKSEEFDDKIRRILRQCRVEIEDKLSYLQTKKIRVSCFSSFKSIDDFLKNILMWSHYSDNHRGFCVEYDMSSFKKSFEENVSPDDFHHNKDIYLDGKMRFSIKAGLFPVMYGSQVVSLPTRELLKSKIVSNKLISSYNIDKAVYRSYLTKSSNWSYENEWRIIIDDRVCKYYDYKIPFPYIKTIFVGCHMEDSMVRMIRDIATGLNIPIKIMKLQKPKFTLWDSNDDIKIYQFWKEMERLNDPFE